MYVQELSYNKVRDISRVVKKDDRECTSLSMSSSPAAIATAIIMQNTCRQELKDGYGVDMKGPARRLADVACARNAQRDMLRAFPPVATYLELEYA